MHEMISEFKLILLNLNNCSIAVKFEIKLGLKYFWSCVAAGSSFDVLLDGVG
jgi:hypothetical protein